MVPDERVAGLDGGEEELAHFNKGPSGIFEVLFSVATDPVEEAMQLAAG